MINGSFSFCGLILLCLLFSQVCISRGLLFWLFRFIIMFFDDVGYIICVLEMMIFVFIWNVVNVVKVVVVK